MRIWGGGQGSESTDRIRRSILVPELQSQGETRGTHTSLMKIPLLIVAMAPIPPVTIVGRAYGKSWKNCTWPKMDGNTVAGFARAPPSWPYMSVLISSKFDTRTSSIPIMGPRNIPKLPENAKNENARAWVFAVLFSLIMVRIVLHWNLVSVSGKSLHSMAAGITYTIVPAKRPSKHRIRIMAQMVPAKPNKAVANETPASDKTRMGLRPK